MTPTRICCKNREEWLQKRLIGIGGSEAAAAVGMSKWQTPVDLWKLKLGITQPKDLSGNPAVQQGNRMEPALRTMFATLHPEFEVEYHQFDMLFQADRQWLFATLDGELIDLETGERGILEIKTATPSGKAGWSEWSEGKTPGGYYVQLLHQLLATGYDFSILFAALFAYNGDITLREYSIARKDVEDDLAWLLEQETRFWEQNVLQHRMPPMPLTI